MCVLEMCGRFLVDPPFYIMIFSKLKMILKKTKIPLKLRVFLLSIYTYIHLLFNYLYQATPIKRVFGIFFKYADLLFVNTIYSYVCVSIYKKNIVHITSIHIGSTTHAVRKTRCKNVKFMGHIG